MIDKGPGFRHPHPAEGALVLAFVVDKVARLIIGMRLPGKASSLEQHICDMGR
jgi:hypothetical protein